MPSRTEESETEYHNVTLPAFEKDPWLDDYDELAETFDVNVKLSGLLQDRPDAIDTPENAWYEATDENLIYRRNSEEEWEVIAHGGSDSPVPEGYYESLQVSNEPTQDNDVARLIDLSDVETEIELLFAPEFDDLPDPENVEDPTVAYVTELDDYLGVFQE